MNLEIGPYWKAASLAETRKMGEEGAACFPGGRG